MSLKYWMAAGVLLCGIARGAETPPDKPAETPFEAGTKSFSLSGGYITPIRFSEDHMANFNLAGGYYFWNNNSINVELQGSYVDQPSTYESEDALLGAIGLLGRWHFLNRRPFSLFIDGGGMVSYADHEVPVEGTNFNFIGKVGGGATLQIKDHTFLMGGVRYFHLSNGQIRGQDDNPTFDGVEFWGGVMWTW